LDAGVRSARWDLRTSAGRRVSNGIYFVRLTDGQSTVQRKLVVAH
jgi:hypothetical protein